MTSWSYEKVCAPLSSCRHLCPFHPILSCWSLLFSVLSNIFPSLLLGLLDFTRPIFRPSMLFPSSQFSMPLTVYPFSVYWFSALCSPFLLILIPSILFPASMTESFVFWTYLLEFRTWLQSSRLLHRSFRFHFSIHPQLDFLGSLTWLSPFDSPTWQLKHHHSLASLTFCQLVTASFLRSCHFSRVYLFVSFGCRFVFDWKQRSDRNSLSRLWCVFSESRAVSIDEVQVSWDRAKRFCPAAPSLRRTKEASSQFRRPKRRENEEKGETMIGTDENKAELKMKM